VRKGKAALEETNAVSFDPEGVGKHAFIHHGLRTLLIDLGLQVPSRRVSRPFVEASPKLGLTANLDTEQLDRLLPSTG